jgi:hypothetical protein
MKVQKGQIWVRKEPVPDGDPEAEWNRVEVGGFAEPNEHVVRPVSLFEAASEDERHTLGESVTAEILQEAYTLESEPEAQRTPQLGVDALEAWL